MVWNWFINALLYVGFTVLHGLLSPREREPGIAPPGTLDLATAEEGRAIPLVCGTVMLRSPNVVWWGDFGPTAIEEGGRTVGHRLLATIHYALCLGPVDAILQILWDETRDAGPTEADFGTYRRFTFAQPNLYGDKDVPGQGGIEGVMDVYYGGLAQTADPYLESILGVSLPAHRGVCHAVLKHMYLGNDHLRPVWFVVRRLPNTLGLTGGAHDVAGDANPAAFLYELLTDARWGLGISSGLVDVAGFRAVGATLKAENLGVSLVVDQPSRAADIIQTVLRHIDGVLYTDPATGLLTLRLARADYVVGDLPHFDETVVESCRLERVGWDETRNLVRVRYVDRDAGFEERIASAMDLANVQLRGGEISAEEYDFRGISNAAAAQARAALVLRTVSYPLAPIELVLGRAAQGLGPGSVFRLTWPPLALAALVCRVSRLRGGSLTDGRIHVDASPDIFAAAWTAYVAPPPTQWNPPVVAPVAAVAERMLEAPYTLVDLEERRVWTLFSRGASPVLGYEVWSDPAGGTAYARTATVGPTTPSGTLVANLLPAATSLVIENGVDLARLRSISAAALAIGQNVLLVGEELVAWQTVTDNGNGTWTIGGLVRGVLDTTPRLHATSQRVWFVSDGHGISQAKPYPEDLFLPAKFLPFNSLGRLAIGSAALVTITTSNRAPRPWVPTAIEENGIAHPTVILGELALTWAHRNRKASASYADAHQTATAESGATYRARVYGETGSLIHTESGLTGESWTYAAASEISEGGLGRLNDELRVVLETVHGPSGLVSFQSHDHTFHRSGYGLRWGEYYGGVEA